MPCSVVCDPSATSLQGIAHLDTTASGGQGVQGCAGGSDQLPIHGRVTVFVSSSNDVTVAADGDDAYNTGGAAGWDRVDVKHTGKACFRRGSGGTYWTKTGGTSNPDSANETIDSTGPHGTAGGGTATC